MLSQTTEYALRAAVFLAAHRPDPQTNVEIARHTRMPPAYLAKVLHGLARAGVVTSQRGVNGGFVLAKPNDELTLLEIVTAVEPIERIGTSPLGIAAHGANLCPLHSKLDRALALVEEAFRDSTLAEILEDPSPSIPLCPFPRIAPSAREGEEFSTSRDDAES